MHPLSTFPFLLTFVLISPLLLRLSVGILRLLSGIEKIKKEKVGKIFSIIQIFSSIFIIIGLYSQINALIALAIIGVDFFKERKQGNLSRERNALTVLMSIILISILFSGPGFFAFDLPL